MEHDKGAFKTPTLRSIIETAPYMHDGVFKTLEEVVDFLDQGGGHNPNLSPLLKPLGLSKEEKADLVAFLKALTGEPIKFEMPKFPK
jgi:cytochrome c peroxidase